jgi:hypothetical protein
VVKILISPQCLRRLFAGFCFGQGVRVHKDPCETESVSQDEPNTTENEDVAETPQLSDENRTQLEYSLQSSRQNIDRKILRQNKDFLEPTC